MDDEKQDVTSSSHNKELPFILRYKKEHEFPKFSPIDEADENDAADLPPPDAMWEGLSANERNYYSDLLERVEEMTKKDDSSNSDDDVIKKEPKKPVVEPNLMENLSKMESEMENSQPNFYSYAKQPKTLNYLLSSKRCWNVGWTVRPKSPKKRDEYLTESELIVLQNTEKQKSSDFVEKSYENGNKFQTFFTNDSTGCVWYKSGNLALVMSTSKLHHHPIITIYEDRDAGGILGVFNPEKGNFFAQNSRADQQLMISPHGGVHLIGSRRKTWNWEQTSTGLRHYYFQPIIFPLNRFICVRVTSQCNIVISFVCGLQTAKFAVSTKVSSPPKVQQRVIPEEKFLSLTKSRIRKLMEAVRRKPPVKVDRSAAVSGDAVITTKLKKRTFSPTKFRSTTPITRQQIVEEKDTSRNYVVTVD